MNYSPVEIAADAVRSARFNDKKMGVKIKYIKRKNVQDIVLEKIVYIAENKLIIKTSPFFYE